MKKLKIVTIGGGSSYTPELVEGFINRHKDLPVSELWLVDVESGREKLEIVGNLAKRMVDEAGIDMQIHLSLDRRAALLDADFVTTQMRVGQLKARILDERIPISHGMIGQETNGAGGMFKAFRTIPVILDIVKDMEELCPEAWLINFTNPAGMVTEAVLRYTNFERVIGLCNVPFDMKHSFASILDVAPEEITMELSGVNHHVFVTDVFHKGKTVMSTILDKYVSDSEETLAMKNFDALSYSPDFLRGLGAIPCPYHNYYYFTQEQLAKNLKEFEAGTVRGEVVAKLEAELFELYKDQDLKVKPKQLEQRGGAHYSDAACSLIDSIYNDRKDIQYVNVRNNGAVSNLPLNSAVEIACVITGNGPQPITVGPLNPKINGTIQTIKSFEQMTIEAAVTGNVDLAITALSSNPLCPSDRLAGIVVRELLEAHRDYLPQFKR
ncbi:6-phospho-beta-glucosidase [Erysipelothrix sp. HDW6C]|uniref:6-phospho-beta-glucosidase n=1 Tax=Erysipelothrix sp. HDW6C TaxID=2714930 RepID=UPI00140C4E87|nr:6-phospho-beta-glucosidase [Erysipelothrix sp. HDW6C]QIK68891.1 6-phospho-beta-glucosidase [Erysipelothrix sp. HDW6C]